MDDIWGLVFVNILGGVSTAFDIAVLRDGVRLVGGGFVFPLGSLGSGESVDTMLSFSCLTKNLEQRKTIFPNFYFSYLHVSKGFAPS